MGLLLSLPLAGVFGTVGSSCLAGLAFCFTSTAASMFCKSCNCNSSIATRVGFAMIFCLNSMLAWLMKSPLIIEQIEKITHGYLKMECEDDKCYGVLAVHRICFALSLFHLFLGSSLVGVRDTKDKRAAIQNGWWGPKALFWLVLLVVSFFIPNAFFMFWGNYVALIGATIFILLGLVLLVDFAHTWSETCLENWENSNSNMWQWILIGSTAGMYIAAITITAVLFAFFAGPDCGLNRFFIGFNLALCVLITILCVHPAVQEANPRSGLAQSGMVAAYCTYLVMSAVGNHAHASCNPLHGATGTKNTTIFLGAAFTFLAIAYSTSRAATQSRALVGKDKRGAIALPADGEHHAELGVVNAQPGRTETPRYQALLAAVEAGAIPASALEEELYGDEDDDEPTGEAHDDERTGTRYNYTWFHFIFAIGAMYVAMLLTDWNVVKPETSPDGHSDVYIGRSEVAMWMRIVSSWVCMVLYMWSLLAPVIMPDRFGDY
ncbi:serine incorporator/TMS membrane protein [Epithele typhae]|uniref:serine incorporator/TMS membrane protein n=1 Tax=Epithele typhae TaxID=378194 RepID=UPI0020084F4E|nr:serine incorporator/TMS membrane protein [Epithele typhae]KAH9944978.1 serine incorporator/TMS membrane protein [Epithele typhae]